jgi:hypothetical protein
VFGLLLLFIGGFSRADTLPTANANNFVTLFQKLQFSAAAEEFYYPPDSSPQQQRDDFAANVTFLSGLSSVLGKVSSMQRGLPVGSQANLTLGIETGELAYWSSHPEFSRMETVIYSIHSELEGDVSLALNFIHPNGKWKLRSIVYQYPASRPGAREHLNALARKLLPN